MHASTRRELLKMLGGAAAAAPLLSSLSSTSARAQTRNQRRLIVVLNAGGWDPTFSLDPKPGRALVDAAPGVERSFGGITVCSDASRPAVDAYFERWAGASCVVNGVQVRSFVHNDCVKRMLTGSPSETTPDLCAIAAFEQAAELPVPYLALGPLARSGPLAAVSGRAGTSNQLQALVDPDAAYPPPVGPYVPDPGLVPSADDQGLVRRFLDASAARVRKVRGQRGYNKRRIDDFTSSLERADLLAAFAQGGSSLGERAYTVDLNVQIPLAVQALRDGLSHTALLQSGFAWDTHADNSQQGAFHDGLFASLDALMIMLDEQQMLDDTTVLVLSEMGRTPKLNADRGKDHWPVTSCMVMGAGVRGGASIGGTSDEMSALSLDLETGAVDAAGKQLQSANLVAGVLELVGVDPEPYLPGAEVFRGFAA